MDRGFVYSHVLAVYYNWKNKVLLKDKLDDMDKLIAEHGEAIAEKLVTNEKFAETLAGYVTKAMMSSVNVNDENKVPTSAFIHSLAQQITANQTAITALNADASDTYTNDSGNTVKCYRLGRIGMVFVPNQQFHGLKTGIQGNGFSSKALPEKYRPIQGVSIFQNIYHGGYTYYNYDGYLYFFPEAEDPWICNAFVFITNN